MDWVFYAAQVIGALTTLLVVLASQMKQMKHVLLCQIGANLIVALSAAMLGGLSGAWICLVAAVQTVVMYFLGKKNITNKTRNAVLLLFAAMYVGGTVVVYQSWGDVVSCAGALLFLLEIVQTKASRYRILSCLNTTLWLIYDATILNFGNMLTHGFGLVAAVVGIIRLDLKKKNEKLENRKNQLKKPFR